MNTLIFITSHFPFEPGEQFIEAEFPLLYSSFSRMIIISRDVTSCKTRTIPDDVKVYRYNPSSTFAEYFFIPILFARKNKEISGIYKDEIKFRHEISRPLTFRQKLFLLKKIIKGLQLRFFIESIIKKERIEGVITLYSYWMDSGAHAICMIDPRNKIKIARAHSWIDLYEEDSKINYLPLLKNTFLNLDRIFFISEHGKKYFETTLKINHSKNMVSRLGVINPFLKDEKKTDQGFSRIVSCSSLIEVKRIHLIILALENLKTDRKIIWNHFGGGALYNELLDLAQRKLGALINIKFQFMGQVPNMKILEFYASNKIDLFINTSSSEGIPVSIMEAQSFGIPVVASDVGGIRELVREGTGSLLPVDFKPADLTEMIMFYSNLPEEEMNKLRMNAFNNWNLNFNASENYKDFIIKVNSILASDKE